MRVSILTLILFLFYVNGEQLVSIDGEVVIPGNYSRYYRSDKHKLYLGVKLHLKAAEGPK